MDNKALLKIINFWIQKCLEAFLKLYTSLQCSSNSSLSDTPPSSNYKNLTCNWRQLQPFWWGLIADNDLSAINSHATIVLNGGHSHCFLWEELLIFAADLSNLSVTCSPSFSWADNVFIEVIMHRRGIKVSFDGTEFRLTFLHGEAGMNTRLG